ncbi:MAG: hypothetical protein AAF152_15110 [Cyanobacteria bacterium P01_A01_bin.114]
MINFLELALAIIALGGVGGLGNQFFVLIILGFASRGGHLKIPDEFAFIQSIKFLLPVTAYWLAALLAELGLTSDLFLSSVRKISKLMNTWLAPAFGAVLALISVGFITNSSEQFRNVSSLIQLLSPSELLSLTRSSFGLVVAILAGTIGAAILSLLFAFLSYIVNVSLYEENGGNKMFPPLFDNGSVLIALISIYFLRDANPWLIFLSTVLCLVLLIFLVTRVARQVFKVVDHVMDNPEDGLWLSLDFVIWGQGGVRAGEPQASLRTRQFIGFAALYVVFTFSLFPIPVLGIILEFLLQPLMVFIYLYSSRKSARTLWKFLKRKKANRAPSIPLL